MERKPRVSGIICEFNPFHKGHASLLQAARAQGAQFVIAVMSGNYVQRGGPAIFSKWARTEMALACGADLVVELPLPWAMAGAERFALGGVSLLKNLGCVDFLSFGSESGDSEGLCRAAQAMLSPQLGLSIRRGMQDGCTFAQAREKAAYALFGEDMARLLRSPNDILAVEYCKALQTLQSSMSIFTLRRTGAPHDGQAEDATSYASSSQIRKLILSGEEFSGWMPEPASRIAHREIIQGLAPVCETSLEQAVLTRLRTLPPEQFARLPDLSEGLENRLYKAARTAGSLQELYFSVKTKRYPLARIRRIVFAAFLGIPFDVGSPVPPYARILGFRRGAEELLTVLKKCTRIPIVSTAAQIKSLSGAANRIAQREALACDLYALGQPKIQPCGRDLTQKIIVADEEEI